MIKFAFGAAAAALALSVPFAVQAQQLPPAVVAVVDTDRIIRECTVCVAANTQLQQQIAQLRARADQLGAPLRTEGQAIETALRALPAGSQPDAAMQARINTFQTNQRTAQQEVNTQQQQLEANRNFVLQQIGQRVQPAVQQVMQQRGASVVVDVSSTLAASPTLDVTPAVLAVVNQNTAPLNVVAPPPQQPAAQAPAAGTPAPAATTPPRPRPQGR